MTEIQVKQRIGQMNSSIEKIESYLTDEEFKDYCDSANTLITYWRTVLKHIKQAKEENEPEINRSNTIKDNSSPDDKDNPF